MRFGFWLILLLSGCSHRPVNSGNSETGLASWYGRDFQGKRMASGARFNMYKLTAAHRTLPLNTLVNVTNLQNQRSVQVRITDRGPFEPRRIIDLSFAAAKALGMLAVGTVPVRIEQVERSD